MVPTNGTFGKAGSAMFILNKNIAKLTLVTVKKVSKN
jgi:hypothetical protein